MEWLNEPASWQRTGDVLTVSVDPSTDFWRETGYGYIRDSGHVYGEVLAGDLDVSVRMRCTLAVQYDQAGVMLRADERTWLKTGVEFFEGRARLSTVLTLGRSSWMVTDLPEGTDEIVLRVSRRGDAVEVRYVIEDGRAELAALVFMPPGREVLAGVMAAAPEGPGFRVTFHDLRITERDWSGAAADAPSWSEDQPGWTSDEAPAWRPADGEPGWPAPRTGEDAPAWPATAEEEPPAWPGPAAADEEPEWQVPAAGDDGPQWPVPAAQEVDAGWRTTTGGEEDPGWAAAGDDEAGWVTALAAAGGDDEPGWAAPSSAAGGDGEADQAGPSSPVGGDGEADQAAPSSPVGGDGEPGWAAAPSAAQVGNQDRADADEPAAGDSSGPAEAEAAGAEPAGAEPAGAEPAGTEPAGTEPAGTETGAEPAGAEPAGAEPARAEPIAAALAGPEPAGPEPTGPAPADPEHVRDDPAGPEHIAEATATKEPATEEPADKNGNGGPWSPAPLADHLRWARPVSGNGESDVDPAADWEQLAAGAQAAAARAQTASWRAQTDADVANEWPGPPLRTAMRNGLLANDAGPRPVADQSVDDAQTDPGLPRPRQAAEEPGRMETGPSTPPEAGVHVPDGNSATAPPAASATAPPAASAAGPDGTVAAAPTRPDQPEPAPSGREARRARSRRGAADVPAEPDAADEWISLLTADPVDE
jgi:hypothetical protein